MHTTTTTFIDDDEQVPELVPFRELHASNNGNGQSGHITVCTTTATNGEDLVTLERSGLEFTDIEALHLIDALEAFLADKQVLLTTDAIVGFMRIARDKADSAEVRAAFDDVIEKSQTLIDLCRATNQVSGESK